MTLSVLFPQVYINAHVNIVMHLCVCVYTRWSVITCSQLSDPITDRNTRPPRAVTDAAAAAAAVPAPISTLAHMLDTCTVNHMFHSCGANNDIRLTRTQ